MVVVVELGAGNGILPAVPEQKRNIEIIVMTSRRLIISGG